MVPAAIAQTLASPGGDINRFTAAFGQVLDVAEEARSVSLVRNRPGHDHARPDAYATQFVDGQLRIWIVQAKLARRPEDRERARLGVFAALNARRAILESRTEDGWKAAVAEFARTVVADPQGD
jgi:hypothetical protein